MTHIIIQINMYMKKNVSSDIDVTLLTHDNHMLIVIISYSVS